MWPFTWMEFSKGLHCCCKNFSCPLKGKTNHFWVPFCYLRMLWGICSVRVFAGSVRASHPVGPKIIWEIPGPSSVCYPLLTCRTCFQKELWFKTWGFNRWFLKLLFSGQTAKQWVNSKQRNSLLNMMPAVENSDTFSLQFLTSSSLRVFLIIQMNGTDLYILF